MADQPESLYEADEDANAIRFFQPGTSGNPQWTPVVVALKRPEPKPGKRSLSDLPSPEVCFASESTPYWQAVDVALGCQKLPLRLSEDHLRWIAAMQDVIQSAMKTRIGQDWDRVVSVRGVSI